MKSKVYGTLLTLAATAVAPCGVSATTAYLLTRNKTNTENTDRGIAAPTS